jgi:hypothetical protein
MVLTVCLREMIIREHGLCNTGSDHENIFYSCHFSLLYKLFTVSETAMLVLFRYLGNVIGCHNFLKILKQNYLVE